MGLNLDWEYMTQPNLGGIEQAKLLQAVNYIGEYDRFCVMYKIEIITQNKTKTINRQNQAPHEQNQL